LIGDDSGRDKTFQDFCRKREIEGYIIQDRKFVVNRTKDDVHGFSSGCAGKYSIRGEKEKDKMNPGFFNMSNEVLG
jgi:hypothetical protein